MKYTNLYLDNKYYNIKNQLKEQIHKMSKLIWINDLNLFKIQKKYSTQYLCICAQQYINELKMEVGDVIFIKDNLRLMSYKRLGYIKAFNGRKIIIGIMDDIGIGTKKKIENLHNESLNKKVYENEEEEEIENDGTLY